MLSVALQFFGAVFLLIIASAVFGLLVLRFKLKKFVKRMEAAAGEAGSRQWADSPAGAIELEGFQSTFGPANLGRRGSGGAISAAVARKMRELDEALFARFRDETTLSVRRWEEVRDRIVTVHDRTPVLWLRETLDDHGVDTPDDWLAGLKGRGVRSAFEKFNASLDESKQFEKLGTVSKPVEADVYAVPADESDERSDEDEGD